ncbi:MAG: nucleotide pyrophosphohydrolase [Thermoplasmata archaeon]|nr:nucleotide pyrophosphohydrolase [Thermoplasmata archaeon]
MSDSLQRLAENVRAFIEKRDWAKYHNPKDIAIALSIEASELLEIFQWRKAEREISDEDLQKIRLETADVVIFALSMANACRFDLEKAVLEKISINEGKYPVSKSKGLFD